MTLTPADRAVLERWWTACLAQPGTLPDDLEPVFARLIRAVGRGELPDAGPVFVKVMSFPRWRHRLRYAVRPLPGVHEARMLERARVAGALDDVELFLNERGERVFVLTHRAQGRERGHQRAIVFFH